MENITNQLIITAHDIASQYIHYKYFNTACEVFLLCGLGFLLFRIFVLVIKALD